MQKRYASDAFVIRLSNYSESDKVVVLFSREHGKIRLMAKGVKKLTSRKRGSLAVFNKVRFSGVSSKGMDIITESELISTNAEIRSDLSRVSVAYFIVESVDKLTHDGERNDPLFFLIEKYLNKVSTTKALKKMRYEFIKDILVLLGYWPIGDVIGDPDELLEETIERKMFTKRVGKRMLS